MLFTYRALEWIDANLNYFNPNQGKSSAYRFWVTPFVELAIVCLCLYRQPEFRQDARLRSFLQFILQIYTTLSFRDRLFRGDEAFVSYAWITVVLNACGLLNDHHEWQAIQELINRSNIQYREMLPFHRIELRNLLDLGNFTHRLPSYRTLYQSSILSKPLNISYMTDRDVYSLTHVLFFLSDFGWRPLTILSPSQLERIYQMVELLLGMYAQKNNWDLVSELLICCHCLGRTTSDLYALAWQSLIDAQWSDGTIPGPKYEPKERERLEDTRRQEYVFEQCYHTTLVAALAGALSDRRDKDEA